MKKIFYLLLILNCSMLGLNAQNHSLHFDGSNDQVITSIGINGDFTIQFWMKSYDPITTATIPVIRPFLNINSGDIVISQGNGQLDVSNNLWMPSSINPYPSVNINDGLWHHFSFVYNWTSGDIEIFVDNNLSYVVTAVSNLSVTSFSIGDNSGPSWWGEIDEVQIWDKTITSSNILSEKYCPLSGNETDLLLYWNFDGGIAGGNNVGSNATDLTSNGNDGIMFSLI